VIPILHLRQGTALYGADRAVLALSASTPRPYLPIVGAIGRPGVRDALAEEARRRGLAAVRFDSASRFDLRCARAIARVARERGVRLLHAHDFKALFVALVAGLLARVPVVATFHGDTRALPLAPAGYSGGTSSISLGGVRTSGTGSPRGSGTGWPRAPPARHSGQRRSAKRMPRTFRTHFIIGTV